MQRFFADEGMQFATVIGLAFAYANIADVGETLATHGHGRRDERVFDFLEDALR